MGQFKALMTKNWILAKRSKIGSVIQVLIPILFMVFVFMIRGLAKIEQYDQQSFLPNPNYTFTMYGDPVSAINDLSMTYPITLKQCQDGHIVALAPTGDPMVNSLKAGLEGLGYTVNTYASDDEIDEIVRDFGYGNQFPYFCFGLSFQNSGANYKYNLRFNMSNSAREGPQPQLNLTTEKVLDIPLYYDSLFSGFIGLTTMANNIIVRTETGDSNDMIVNKIGPIYQEEYTDDPIYQYLGNSFEYLGLFPLLIIFLRQTSSMLEEKQKKIRQTMSIMGMKTWIYYLTWFLRYFIVYLIIHLISCAIFVGAFSNIPYIFPLIITLLFDIVLIIQSFFVQIFVTKAKIGIVFALLFFILQYIINYIVANNPDVTLRINQSVAVVPHVAFILAFKQMLYAESMSKTVTFSEVLNDYTISTSIVSLICNIIFWGILTMYLEQVFPNQFGAKKHPCFCFCCCCRGKDHSKVHSEKDDQQEQNSSAMIQNATKDGEIELTNNKKNGSKGTSPIERQEGMIDLSPSPQKRKSKEAEVESVEGKYKEMENNDKAIIIDRLNKKFDDFQAVKNLSMKMYTDQIFVLLGHNGAGKTTTISMLTGMLKPTSGRIEVLGATQVDDIRAKIGLCPQHDTIYDDLTVEEHLQLFSTFRGITGEEMDEEVNKLIRDVNLEEKRDQYSKNLSGGQKRRLSVAMAFSGKSQVILLDEPTSGMDTSARRYIWEMLKSYRNNRVILLTTHFMDQADYLGDRIAIMAGGKLVALGSNVYLKNKFGVGYNISFVKKDISVPNEPIFSLVQKHIPTATILSAVSAQLTVQLPMDKVKIFPQMFNEIDSIKEKIGLLAYGISITTLEEVFLKVGEESGEIQEPTSPFKKPHDGEQINLSLNNSGMDKIKQEESDNVNEQDWERQDGRFERFFSHLGATILKRIRVIKRDLKAFVFELLLPMVIIVLALLLMRITFIKDYGEQTLTYRTYLDEADSVKIPLAWDTADEATFSALKTNIETNYGSQFVVTRANQPTDVDFDKNELFALKKDDEKLKGGIYFRPQTLSGGKDLFPFTSIVNTRSPTSFVTTQTLAAESLMNMITGSGTSTITVVNKPFPRTQDQLKINNTISGFFGALIFSIALSFKFSSIVAFIVKERVDKSKHQQIVSGLNLGSYWMGNFIYDYVLYLILAVFSIIMCRAMDIEALVDGRAFSATIALFIIYGLANIPFTYLLGYAFKDYGNAQGLVYFINFVSGGLVTIIILVLRWVSKSSSLVARILAWALRLLPSFSFGEGLINMGSVNLLSITERDGEEEYQIYDAEITLAPIIYLSISVIVYFGLVFLFEALQNNESFMRFFTSQAQIDETKQITEDDVLLEQKKAIEADPNDYEILTKQLRKVYMIDNEKGHKVAVDNLSFGVQKGEVFGLLGINGAGKTTTFKMLAGEIVSTSGESFFGGLQINKNLSTIRKNLGYCPQFDALIENLTVREQLQLFYDMKCLPKKYKDESIARKIKEMDLQKYEDRLSGTLSGGNKRKLSVALAMIGNPSILFLDEPSTGMDPKARRFMWKVISRISTERKQSTVILTTHAMEEAEALSSRLGIMVSGNFKCIGTPQHIKSKYGKGFEIQIKAKNIQREEILKFREQKGLGDQINFFEGEFPQTLNKIGASQATREQISAHGSGNYIWEQLKSKKKCALNSLLEFHLVQQKVANIQKCLQKNLGEVSIIENFQTYIRFKTVDNIKIGKMFELLESEKEKLGIMQYSIKQATVEQIFNKFAQEDENYRMD